MWGNELAHSQMDSLQNFKSLKNNIMGENSLDWKILYTIKNILIFKCLKWAHMTHLNTYNIGYGRKKGKESKCQFHCRSLKVENHVELRVCNWHAMYGWKNLNKGYNFALNHILIRYLHKKLRASKVLGISILKISRFQSWES
jgi:hypothetical protein